ERSDFGSGRDIVEDLAEGDGRAIDKPEVLLGAGFELGPDFTIVLVENLKPPHDMRPVEHAGVGDEDHLYRIEAQAPLEIGGGGDNLVEIAVGRGLAVAGEGDVVEATE